MAGPSTPSVLGSPTTRLRAAALPPGSGRCHMLEMHAWRDALITIGVGRLHCFLAHLLRLGPEERLQRFCHQADDAWLRAYVARLDLAQRKIIGCFEGEQMRGAAELRALNAAPLRLVEAAFSVEKDWCGQGVERA